MFVTAQTNKGWEPKGDLMSLKNKLEALNLVSEETHPISVEITGPRGWAPTGQLPMQESSCKKSLLKSSKV